MEVCCGFPTDDEGFSERVDRFISDRGYHAVTGLRRRGREQFVDYVVEAARAKGLDASVFPSIGSDMTAFYSRDEAEKTAERVLKERPGTDVVYGQDLCHQVPAVVRYRRRCRMTLGIGIDTGGTFTDAVIIDLESEEVLRKSKSPTTPEDLSIGIRGAMSYLDKGLLSHVSVVSLSSTLATNSVVEGKGCRVALICVGFDVEKPDAEEYVSIKGGHNIHGGEEQDLDVAKAKEFMYKIQGKVGALAISSFMSVRNPDHENRLKAIAKEVLGVPTVCGHDLSSKLGFGVRTSTCVMNARLIPVMRSLIDSVKKVMAEYGIRAPLMMIRGDGTMMGETVAMEKPIETIMSGPTASMIGAVRMTGLKNAVVMDMGGTTTDIGILRNGRPALAPEGMTVAGKKTHVLAARISTAGIGGDSRIMVNGGKIVLKSTRAIPLCVAASRWPSVVDSLMSLGADVRPDPQYPDDMVYLDSELFVTVGFPPSGVYVSPESRLFLEMASERPVTAREAAETINTYPSALDVRGLEARGYIQRIAFTPTDVLHVDGTYLEYAREASVMGARYLSRKCGMTVGEFVSGCRDRVKAKLCTELMKVLLADELGERPLEPYSASMIAKSVLGSSGDYGCSIRLNIPIIGMGAPSGTYIRWAGDAFGTRTVIDPDSDVGNALGAITSTISETVEIVISPEDLDSPQSGFEVFSPEGKETCESLEKAVARAEEIGKAIAGERARRSGATDIVFETSRGNRYLPLRGIEVLVDCVLTVTAAGKPGAFGAQKL